MLININIGVIIMKYYKVLSQYDQFYKNSRVHDDKIYIQDELYTETEIKKQNLNTRYMEIIEIPKNKTYWFFGCRYA